VWSYTTPCPPAPLIQTHTNLPGVLLNSAQLYSYRFTSQFARKRWRTAQRSARSVNISTTDRQTDRQTLCLINTFGVSFVLRRHTKLGTASRSEISYCVQNSERFCSEIQYFDKNKQMGKCLKKQINKQIWCELKSTADCYMTMCTFHYDDTEICWFYK